MRISLPTRPVTIFGRKVDLLVVGAGVLVVAGIVAVTGAITDQHHAPRPSQQAQTAPLGPSGGPSSSPSGSSASRAPTTSSRSRSSLAPGDGRLVLASSQPVRLDIPAIGVDSSLLQLGLNPDGTAETPPLTAVSEAGWYRFSPTPGADGSSVMLGHIDSAAYGPGVFYRLGALRPGDEVDVTRTDGATAVFRVDRVAEYPKSAFPTQLIYGPTRYPSLKLVTCGGTFDASTGSYNDNVVAFATLVSARH